MEQTFHDLCREQREAGAGLLGFVLWTFAETAAGIGRENLASVPMHSHRILRLALATGSILLLPLVAMQFTDDVAWGPMDFIAAGVLLFGAGLTYELVASRVADHAYRVAVGAAMAVALLLIWVNLAVGLIAFAGGPEARLPSEPEQHNAANVVYLGVLAVGLISAVIGRLRADGMARALLATAIAQALVPVIAEMIWTSQVTPVEASWSLFGVNGFFVALWAGSASCFATPPARWAEQRPGRRLRGV